MRVLFDTDIVFDLLLARPGFVEAAAALFELNDQGVLKAYISAITPFKVNYIARKVLGKADAEVAIYELFASVDVTPVNLAILQAALVLPVTDYEDAAQAASAQAMGLDAIVTRNLADYKAAPLPVFSPVALLAHFKIN
jgi:predicted nucleic acid-binding protein